jgi:hypothetical protein
MVTATSACQLPVLGPQDYWTLEMYMYVCTYVCTFLFTLPAYYLLAVRCKLFHITRKPNAMFVGPCCTVCYCLCVNCLFPCRLPWNGSLRQIWDTLEHERQVILSQHHLTAVILVIFPDSNYTQILFKHVLLQTSYCQACYV